jgi:hypothetical protein
VGEGLGHFSWVKHRSADMKPSSKSYSASLTFPNR